MRIAMLRRYGSTWRFGDAGAGSQDQAQAPAKKSPLGSILAGAVGGFLVGGPPGAVIGAIAGVALGKGLVAPQGQPQARPPSQPSPPAAASASQTGGGAMLAQTSGGPPANTPKTISIQLPPKLTQATVAASQGLFNLLTGRKPPPPPAPPVAPQPIQVQTHAPHTGALNVWTTGVSGPTQVDDSGYVIELPQGVVVGQNSDGSADYWADDGSPAVVSPTNALDLSQGVWVPVVKFPGGVLVANRNQDSGAENLGKQLAVTGTKAAIQGGMAALGGFRAVGMRRGVVQLGYHRRSR